MKAVVGGLLKEVREQKGFTQKHTARLIGFSEQFLGKIEAGGAKLPLPYAKKIQKIFKLSTMDLANAYLCDYATVIEKALALKKKH